MESVEWVDLPCMQDERGGLVAIEGEIDIPFRIARVYYLFRTSRGGGRGFHAHRDLRQLVVPVAGRCIMRLDDGRQCDDAALESPTKGLMIGPLIWHEVHDASADCVLLVVASARYDSGDYIRNYEEFLACVRHG